MIEGYVIEGGFAYYCSDKCLEYDRHWRSLNKLMEMEILKLTVLNGFKIGRTGE